jgi:hypothetical protein
MLSKVRNVIQNHGVSALPSRTVAYARRQIVFGFAGTYQQRVRPFMPARGPVRCGGIAICHDVKWGDRIIPRTWIPLFERDNPDYEVGLVRGLKDIIKAGDSVVAAAALA